MPDRVNGHCGQATLVAPPSELASRTGGCQIQEAMTALEEVRWSTSCGSGHGLGLRLFGGLFYLPDPRARSALLGLVESDTSRLQGDGRTLFVLDSSPFVFDETPGEVFQKQGLLIDGGFFLGCPRPPQLAGAPPNLTPEGYPCPEVSMDSI